MPNVEQQLTANEWTFDHPASSPSISPNYPITIQFTSGGLVSGVAPCNSYRGTYVIDKDKITMSHLSQTLKKCEPEVMTAEHEYLTALEATHYLEPTNRDQLQLTNGTKSRLTYNAVRPT